MSRQFYAIAAKFLRFTFLRILTLSKLCYIVVSQMWFANSVQNLWTTLNRQRKLVVAALILLFLLLYLWPSWLTVRRTPAHIDNLELCLQQKLSPFHAASESYDVIINRPDLEGMQAFLPYIGNGYIGAVTYGSNSLYIKYNRALSVPVKFYPIVRVRVEGSKEKEANVIDFYSGISHKLQCIQGHDGIISVTSQSYAHRTRPRVLIQEIRIENPKSSQVTVDIEQVGASDWSGAKTTTRSATSKHGTSVEYTEVAGSVQVPQEVGVYGVVTATTKISDTVTVNAKSVYKKRIVTVVEYTDGPVPSGKLEALLKQIQTNVETEMTNILQIDAAMLKKEHTSVWKQLWSSGFSISLSKAPGSLNGDAINSTLYYVLSHTRAPLSEVGRPSIEKSELQKLLYFPDRCYNGHHTLQNSKLWTQLDSEEDIITVVQLWKKTLEKQGCASMLKAGMDGILQAMVLSFGALRFQNDHLEFATHPKDLHRDYYFRRINYGNNTHVNISVEVGEDNKAVLYAALDRNDRPYFACDAGCLDEPVKLSKKKATFPVKLTDPVTAILYVTSDHQHMKELKDIIHPKEVAIAPAHEHHVIALHKHGHHLGGLPTIFWVSISFLILIFHLFLFKLIINEYCSTGSSDRFGRSKYNL